MVQGIGQTSESSILLASCSVHYFSNPHVVIDAAKIASSYVVKLWGL